MISLIVAYAHNNVIGNKGRIPWDLPDDREHFKKLTYGHVVIMGRRTFEEIHKKFGAGLPGRETIVVSKSVNFQGDNYRTVASLPTAVEYAEKSFPQKEIFLCGGESIYREALCLKLPEKLYITEIDADIPGDAFFPEYDKADYLIEENEEVALPMPHSFINYRYRT